jgi:hypothetical protein
VGVYEASTDLMAFCILTSTGKVVIRKDVWAVSSDEMSSIEVQASLKLVDDAINNKLGNELVDTQINAALLEDVPMPPLDLFEDDDEVVKPYDPEGARREADDFTPEALDEYLTAQVLLPHGGELQKTTVRARVKDRDGLPMGRRKPNPLLDTRNYEIEFPDGSTAAISANTIAENLYAQVDAEGHSYSILKEITDHRTNGNAISKAHSLIAMPQLSSE